MGQFFDSIPESHIDWIAKQHVFWVATAPLSSSGHVSISPKGVKDTFHVVDKNRVWYEDLTGSGVETISHIRENGRITVMFNAFEGAPRILRLFGTGHVYEFGTPEYEAYIKPFGRQPGSRSVIAVDIHKVGTSCGYSVPFFEFKSHRNRLHQYASKLESVEQSYPTDVEEAPEGGIRKYWEKKNTQSIDGLPGLLTAPAAKGSFQNLGVFEQTANKPGLRTALAKAVDLKIIIGFILGVIVSTAFTQASKGRLSSSVY